MGALSLPKPQSTNQYGRDPQSPTERLRRRGKTAGGGWCKLQYAMVADLARLSRGASCTHLFLAIRAHEDTTNHEGWTPALSLEDWANLAFCDVKEVQRNRDYMKSRKMGDCKVDTKRLYSFRLKPESWEALEDYKTWQAKQVKAEVDDEPAADDPAQNNETKAGNWRMSKPVNVPRGKTSKPFSPDCGIARIRFSTPMNTPDGVDISFFSVVQAGDLIITPTVTLVAGVQKEKSDGSKQVKANAEDMGVLRNGGNRANGNRRTAGEEVTVDHPRAAELAKLFDPLLGKAKALPLSADLASLWAACDAVADCDHDHLVHFVMNRAANGPIRKPSHAKLICGEALQSWKASKIIGGTRLSKSELDVICEKERAELAKKREELRRRK